MSSDTPSIYNVLNNPDNWEVDGIRPEIACVNNIEEDSSFYCRMAYEGRGVVRVLAKDCVHKVACDRTDFRTVPTEDLPVEISKIVKSKKR